MQQRQRDDDDDDDDDGDPPPPVGGGCSTGLGGSGSSGGLQGSAGSRPAVFDQMMSDVIPQLRSAIQVPSAASPEEATSLGDDEAWSSEEDDGSSDLDQDLDLEGMPELVDDGKVRASTLYSGGGSPLAVIVTDDFDDSPNHLR